mgnify:FL=1
MVLEMERDRGRPIWPPCIFRERKGEKRLCTNGYAIENYGLTRTTEIPKPEVGILYSPSTCQSCSYRVK